MPVGLVVPTADSRPSNREVRRVRLVFEPVSHYGQKAELKKKKGAIKREWTFLCLCLVFVNWGNLLSLMSSRKSVMVEQYKISYNLIIAC